MKKIIIFLSFITASFLTFAQKQGGGILSEAESKQIVESNEYKNVILIQNEFLDKVAQAVNNGATLNTLKATAVKAVNSGDNIQIYTLIFGDYNAGNDFIRRLADTKKAFRDKFPVLDNYRDSFICKTCRTTLVDETIFFFDKFNNFNANRYSSEGTNMAPAEGPTCGSYWNQLKLAACATVCSASSAGIGLAACGWGCWCTFCTQNSSLATVICAN